MDPWETTWSRLMSCSKSRRKMSQKFDSLLEDSGRTKPVAHCLRACFRKDRLGLQSRGPDLRVAFCVSKNEAALRVQLSLRKRQCAALSDRTQSSKKIFKSSDNFSVVFESSRFIVCPNKASMIFCTDFSGNFFLLQIASQKKWQDEKLKESSRCQKEVKFDCWLISFFHVNETFH